MSRTQARAQASTIDTPTAANLNFRATSDGRRPDVLMDSNFAVTGEASDLRRIVPPPGHGGYPQTRPVTLRLEASVAPVFVATGLNPDPTREPRRRVEPGAEHAQTFQVERGASISAILADLEAA